MSEDTLNGLKIIERKGRILNLAERVDPAHTALVVIDVQNDFCHDDGVFGKIGYDMTWMNPAVEKLRVLIAEARRQKVLTVFIRGNEDGRFLSVPMAETYNRWGFTDSMACKGTWGAEWYEDIRPNGLANEIDFAKHRFSTFEDTSLDLYLRSNGIKTVIASGVVTSGCVESSVRSAFSMGYYSVIPADCVADASEARHQASLSKMEQAFGVVVPSEEIIEAWNDAEAVGHHWETAWKTKEVLRDVPSQVEPAHTVLILLDVQNDFCTPGGPLARNDEDVSAIQAALPAIQELLEAARRAGVMVVHVATEHSDRDLSDVSLAADRDGRLACCRPGTPGAQIVEAVSPLPDEEVVLKHRVGAFGDTRLELLLRSSAVRTTVIVGIDVCVAVESAVRAANDKDFYVVVPRDCVASHGETQHLDAPSLETMTRHFARVVPSAEITSVWCAGSPTAP